MVRQDDYIPIYPSRRVAEVMAKAKALNFPYQGYSEREGIPMGLRSSLGEVAKVQGIAWVGVFPRGTLVKAKAKDRLQITSLGPQLNLRNGREDMPFATPLDYYTGEWRNPVSFKAPPFREGKGGRVWSHLVDELHTLSRSRTEGSKELRNLSKVLLSKVVRPWMVGRESTPYAPTPDSSEDRILQQLLRRIQKRVYYRRIPIEMGGGGVDWSAWELLAPKTLSTLVGIFYYGDRSYTGTTTITTHNLHLPSWWWELGSIMVDMGIPLLVPLWSFIDHAVVNGGFLEACSGNIRFKELSRLRNPVRYKLAAAFSGEATTEIPASVPISIPADWMSRTNWAVLVRRGMVDWIEAAQKRIKDGGTPQLRIATDTEDYNFWTMVALEAARRTPFVLGGLNSRAYGPKASLAQCVAGGAVTRCDGEIEVRNMRFRRVQRMQGSDIRRHHRYVVDFLKGMGTVTPVPEPVVQPTPRSSMWQSPLNAALARTPLGMNALLSGQIRNAAALRAADNASLMTLTSNNVPLGVDVGVEEVAASGSRFGSG